MTQVKLTVFAQSLADGSPLTGLNPVATMYNLESNVASQLDYVELAGGLYLIDFNPAGHDVVIVVDLGATARQRYFCSAWSRRGQLWSVVVVDGSNALLDDAPSIGAYVWNDGTDRTAHAPQTERVTAGVFYWRASPDDVTHGVSVRADAPSGSAQPYWFSNLGSPIEVTGATIGSLVRDALLADATFSALVDGRVYPNELPQGVELPAVVYNTVSDVPENSLDGDASTRLKATRVQIDCYARPTRERGAYALAHDVSDRVENVVGNMTRAVDGADGIYESYRDLYDNVTQYHRVSMDFTLWR